MTGSLHATSGANAICCRPLQLKFFNFFKKFD
jgi:hypothetical protein